MKIFSFFSYLVGYPLSSNSLLFLAQGFGWKQVSERTCLDLNASTVFLFFFSSTAEIEICQS